MKNLLLNLRMYPLVTTQEGKQFEKVMKLDNEKWDVFSIHKKGNYLFSCSYNYSDFLEGFETPEKSDVDYGMFCMYSLTEKRIIRIIIFNEINAEEKLGESINELIREKVKQEKLNCVIPSSLYYI